MTISFLKKGRAAQDAQEKADVEVEARIAQRSARRFWVPQNGKGSVTFLDGALTSDGVVDRVSYNEHRVRLRGSDFNFFPCVAENEPCPLCDDNNLYSFVNIFTVIDHAKWTDRNGKTHQHERRLFVAKRDTMKRLQKNASKL